MVPPASDGSSPAPIDRPILELMQTRLSATNQVERVSITDDSGHLELRLVFASTYYPETVDEAILAVRWYTNDDFKIHYREVYSGYAWECRWDRHPNPHNSRDHFHASPDAATPGEDASWATDYRDVLASIFDDIEQRIEQLWAE